jgi:hypothetical protein
MTTDIDNILVFKTSIQTETDKHRIQITLNAMDEIQQWNVDQHDVDCVLRIVTDSLSPEQIISIIRYNGFECAELE